MPTSDDRSSLTRNHWKLREKSPAAAVLVFLARLLLFPPFVRQFRRLRQPRRQTTRQGEDRMKYGNENEKKSESMRRAAAQDGRLTRDQPCACGRPSAVIRIGHRWFRFSTCRHCAKAQARGTLVPPPAIGAVEGKRAA
jgi:hypothetical protein